MYYFLPQLQAIILGSPGALMPTFQIIALEDARMKQRKVRSEEDCKR